MNANTALNNQLTLQFPFCSRVGGIAGAIVGLFFGLAQQNLDPAVVFSLEQLILIGLLLGLVGWICVLVVVGIWLHYGLGAVAWLGLIISLLTGIVIVVILDMIGYPPAAMLVGLFIGTLLGTLICWLLCGKRNKLSSLATKGGASDANR